MKCTCGTDNPPFITWFCIWWLIWWCGWYEFMLFIEFNEFMLLICCWCSAAFMFTPLSICWNCWCWNELGTLTEWSSKLFCLGKCSSAGEGCREPGVRLKNLNFILFQQNNKLINNVYLKLLSSSFMPLTLPFWIFWSSFFMPLVSNGELAFSLSSLF